jgi:hypothetical protein
MKKLVVAALLTLLFSVGSYATTWIGVISSLHCGPDLTAIRGDDSACIVFVANDQQIYKLPDQEAVKPFIGKEVTVVGTVTQELTIGVTYQTQGSLAIDSVNLVAPLQTTPEEVNTYQGWMTSLQPQVGAVRKVMGGKDDAVTAAEANKLAAILDNVAGFWKTRQNADALGFAVSGRDAAKSLASATTPLERTVALKKVQDACAGCHLAHRSGKAGAFQIMK